jgi:hypothetical protein
VKKEQTKNIIYSAIDFSVVVGAKDFSPLLGDLIAMTKTVNMQAESYPPI